MQYARSDTHSALYDASMVVFDPYKNTTRTVTVPGWSGDKAIQTSGIDYDPVSASVIIALTATEVWDKDSATDKDGITYALGGFGSTIAAVSPSGNVSLWYAAMTNLNSSHYGYGGICYDEKSNKLVVSDTITGGLVTFLSESITHPSNRTPTYLKIEGAPQNWTPIADGLYMPAKYDSKVALWSDDGFGIVVIGSPDCWNSSKYLGRIDTRQGSGWVGSSVSTATVQIVHSIHSVQETFQAVGNITRRSDFTILDITQSVDEIVQQWLWLQ